LRSYLGSSRPPFGPILSTFPAMARTGRRLLIVPFGSISDPSPGGMRFSVLSHEGQASSERPPLDKRPSLIRWGRWGNQSSRANPSESTILMSASIMPRGLLSASANVLKEWSIYFLINTPVSTSLWIMFTPHLILFCTTQRGAL